MVEENERVCVLRPKEKKNNNKPLLKPGCMQQQSAFSKTRLAMPGTIHYYLCAQNTEQLAGIQSISDLFPHSKWARFQSDDIYISFCLHAHVTVPVFETFNRK